MLSASVRTHLAAHRAFSRVAARQTATTGHHYWLFYLIGAVFIAGGIVLLRKPELQYNQRRWMVRRGFVGASPRNLVMVRVVAAIVVVAGIGFVVVAARH